MQVFGRCDSRSRSGGVLARLMPQMQVYFVGVPLAILIGFLIFAAVLTTMMGAYMDYFVGVMHELIPRS